jgi:hypothetical protein
MQLIRADSEIFQRLEAQWATEAANAGESFAEYATPYIDHAREKAQAKVDRYGIYLLQSKEGYEGLAHLNVAALPGTIGRTLRVLWVLLSPRYDYENVAPEALASVLSAFIWEPIRLAAADGPMQAEHVKVHLANLADRRFFEGVVSALAGGTSWKDVALRGNWLHIDDLGQARLGSGR